MSRRRMPALRSARGGSGQTAKAPVSKTGDSRFESWLPRFGSGDSTSRTWGMNLAVGGIVGYLLFFLAGVGFGFAAPPKWRWLPLLFPLALGLWALMKYGPDASVLIRLALALVITVLGIFVGAMLDARSGESSDHARYA
jgi:hypothetical protein